MGGWNWYARTTPNSCIWPCLFAYFGVRAVHFSQSRNVAVESLRDENNQVKQKRVIFSLLFLLLLMLSSLGCSADFVLSSSSSSSSAAAASSICYCFFFFIIFLSHRFQPSIIPFFPKHLSRSKLLFSSSRFTRATPSKPFKWIMLLLYFIRFANFIYANTFTLAFVKMLNLNRLVLVFSLFIFFWLFALVGTLK